MGWVGVGGGTEIKANSAQLELELGNDNQVQNCAHKKDNMLQTKTPWVL